MDVIKNTLSVIHEDEIIFNFDNRKTSYATVTNTSFIPHCCHFEFHGGHRDPFWVSSLSNGIYP